MKNKTTTSFLLILIIFSQYSCEQKKDVIKKDYGDEYVDLNGKEKDSIYNSHRGDIVFLSFYPDMHYDIYKRQLKIEVDKGNLHFGVSVKQNYLNENNSESTLTNNKSNSSSYYLFELDSSETKNIVYSSRNSISLKISMKDNSVNLTSKKPINNNQYGMAIWLFKEKYGLPKDTLITNQTYTYFKKGNKRITFEIDDDSIYTIKYYTKSSLENYNNEFYKKIEENIKLKEKLEKGESKRENVLNNI